MPDNAVAASNLDAGIALVAAVTTELVAEIRDRHDLWPTATAAVGRLTTGAAVFAAGLKATNASRCRSPETGRSGRWRPMRGCSATDHRRARLRKKRSGELPVDPRGKFNVAAAVGTGSLQVTRSSDVGQPYVGIVPIESGKSPKISRLPRPVGTDSERRRPGRARRTQTASSRPAESSHGRCPEPTKRAISARLESRATQMRPVTQIIVERRRPRSAASRAGGRHGVRSHDAVDVRFACRWNRDQSRGRALGGRRRAHTTHARTRSQRSNMRILQDALHLYAQTTSARSPPGLSLPRRHARGRSGAIRPRARRARRAAYAHCTAHRLTVDFHGISRNEAFRRALALRKTRPSPKPPATRLQSPRPRPHRDFRLESRGVERFVRIFSRPCGGRGSVVPGDDIFGNPLLLLHRVRAARPDPGTQPFGISARSKRRETGV